MRIFTIDATLRAGLSLSLEDKLQIIAALDEFGVDYIEADAGERDLFARARTRRARLVAWSADAQPAIASGAAVVATPSMDAVAPLKAAGREVILELEHFFEPGRNAAPLIPETGVDIVVLCDTRGGSMRQRVMEICSAARQSYGGALGIQAWNDSDIAVANTLAAVECGFTHVLGTINGYGPRCGMANLCSVAANIEFKLAHTTGVRLGRLAATARRVADIANLGVRPDQPYAGRDAFPTHASRWADEVLPPANLHWHACPVEVGNERPLLASRRELLDGLQRLDPASRDAETASGTLELLGHEGPLPFKVVSREVRTESDGAATRSAAWVTVEIDGRRVSAQAMATGPVDALAKCLEQCLGIRLELADCKVRMLDVRAGAAARARAVLGWSAGFSTVGVSADTVEASWLAIVDAYSLALIRLRKNAATANQYGWGV